MENDDHAPWERFLAEFWADLDADRLPLLEDYLARFPTLSDRIAEEYRAVESRRFAASAESGASPGATGEGFRDEASGRCSSGAPRSDGIAFRIGRYEVHGQLTRGGMGLVYLGRDPKIGRRVVLKTVRGFQVGRTPALQRLQREARIAGRIAHEGVCPVLDVITHEHEVFVVMPFIEGETLAARIKRARARAGPGTEDPVHLLTLHEQSSESGAHAAVEASSRSLGGDPRAASPEDLPARGDLRHVLRLMEKIAAAVDRMHEAGIVHRDLKPSNIMIRPDGEPVVLDFGLALDESSASTRLTQEGEALGTPLYMAPEQVEGRLSDMRPHTDVYGLGVILYELLTLRLPFEAPSKEAVYHRILKGDPTPPRRLNPRIPRDLDAVCLKALSPSPEQRYATAREFAQDLRNVRTLAPTRAKPPSPFGRAWRSVRRHPWASGALAACAVLVPLALGLIGRMSESIEDREAILRALYGKSLPDDHERLERRFPDPKVRQVLLTDTLDRPSWAVLEDAMPEVTRGRDIEIEPIAPQAASLAQRPVFEFTTTLERGVRAEGVVVLLDADNKPLGEAPFATVGADPPSHVRVELPEALQLEPDRRYFWKVRIRVPDETSADAPAQVFWSRRAPFRVATREELELCLAAPAVGDPVLDRLLRAASLVAHEFAVEARETLAEPFPDGSGEAEQNLRLYLLAHSASLLADPRFYALIAELEERGRASGR